MVAAIITIVAAIALGRTIVGRRFVLAGTNPLAARAAGIRIARYEFGAYVVAGICYAVAASCSPGCSRSRT